MATTHYELIGEWRGRRPVHSASLPTSLPTRAGQRCRGLIGTSGDVALTGKGPPLRQPRITLGPLLVPLNNSWRSLSRPRFAVAGEAVAAWFARRVAILPPQG